MFSWLFRKGLCSCHLCTELRFIYHGLRSAVAAVQASSDAVKGLGLTMSQVSDAAAAIAASVSALKSSVDAAVAAIGAGQVPQSVIDSLNASKAAVDSDKAELDAALNPPSPAPAG